MVHFLAAQITSPCLRDIAEVDALAVVGITLVLYGPATFFGYRHRNRSLIESQILVGGVHYHICLYHGNTTLSWYTR